MTIFSIRGNGVAGPTGVQKTVAVLPFDNVSGDDGIDYLRLALADEVATALSSTPSLAVRPLAASRRFAGGEGSPQAAGRQLRAGGIAERDRVSRLHRDDMTRIQGQRLSERRFRSPERFAPTGAVLSLIVVALPEAAVRLLGIQVDAGRLQDGYDSAQRLVARRPDSGEAHFALGYVLRSGGLLEDSARECDEAVSRDPTNPVFRTCSATFIQLGRYDRALDFVRLDSGSEWSRLVTRWVYQRMGRRHDAREQHRQQAPDYPSGLAPASFHGFIARCLSGTVPTGAGRLSDDDVRTFLTVRDSEPLYFFAGDLAYCGDSAAALRLLRESIPRNYCASSAIEREIDDIARARIGCQEKKARHYRARDSGGHNHLIVRRQAWRGFATRPRAKGTPHVCRFTSAATAFGRDWSAAIRSLARTPVTPNGGTR